MARVNKKKEITDENGNVIGVEVKLKEPELQAILFDEFKRKEKFILFNLYKFYDGANECDMIVVHQNDDMTEFELKSGRQDAIEDHIVKPEKHRLLHERDERCPNYYIMVAPEGVVPRETIKPGYGLWEIKKDLSIRQVVRPKRLNNTKHTTCDLFPKLYRNNYFPAKTKEQYEKLLDIKRKMGITHVKKKN